MSKPSSDGEYVAIVSGATGAQGRALIQLLDRLPEWKKVFAITRRPLSYDVSQKVQHCAVDLTNKEEVQSKLKDCGATRATHLFNAAFAGDMTNTDFKSFTMMKNFVEGAEAIGCPLKFVYSTLGMKWYGLHLNNGKAKTPFREDDPRHLPPNFYYDIHDYLDCRKTEGAPWAWATLMPNPIIGYSTGSYMNLLNCIAVYASICRYLKLPLRWPGSGTGYDCLWDVTDADLLAEAQVWLATHPDKANTNYNITNGDQFRYREMWPKIAGMFGLETGPPLKMPLATHMKHHAETWKRIQKECGLKDVSFEELAQWEFADMNFNSEGDQFAVVNKLRRAGFDKMTVDSDEMFRQKFQQMQEMNIIPKVPVHAEK